MNALARRSVLRLFGAAAGTAAIPGGDASKLTGIGNMAGLGSYVGTVGADTSVTIGDDTTVKTAAWLIANGIPQFVKDGLRRDRRVPNGLDADLVANRSFSLAAKVMIQRDRDFERACADTMRRQHETLAKKAFRKTFGFDLWW